MALLHQELVMDLNPDSVEWCPNQGHRKIVAISTYQLDEACGSRVGRCGDLVCREFSCDLAGMTAEDSLSTDKFARGRILSCPMSPAAYVKTAPPCRLHAYELQQEAERDTWQLHHRAQMDCSGIFDARWAPHTMTPVLALGMADGSMRLVQPSADGGSWECLCDTAVSSGMVLTTDWAKHAANVGRLVTSTSSGQLATLQAVGADCRVTETWHGHDLEAWSIAADLWQADLVHSGADDCTLKGWDLRQSSRQPAFANSRTHTAGVCCIQSSPGVEHQLVTGSYDGKVRLWDLRMLHRPSCTAQLATHGGVWRLKWHPRNPCLLLAACMDKGFAGDPEPVGNCSAVVRLSSKGINSDMVLAEDYPHQKSLGYGADWCHLPAEEYPSLVATCSFYDRLLHLWQPATHIEI